MRIAAAMRAGLGLLLAGSAMLPVSPLSSGSAWARDTVLPPLLPRSEPIALSIAGQPAILRVVRSNEAPEAALAAIEAAWRRGGARVRRDRDGVWQSVSRIGAHGIEAVQLRAGAVDGSDGYLVHWQPQRTQEAAASKARDSLAHRLLPDAAVLLSDTASRAQPGGGGRTLVAWMPVAVDTAARLLIERAAALGLRRRTRGAAGAIHGASGPERAQFYASGGTELALSLHPEGAGTAVVVHLMETTR